MFEHKEKRVELNYRELLDAESPYWFYDTVVQEWVDELQRERYIVVGPVETQLHRLLENPDTAVATMRAKVRKRFSVAVPEESNIILGEN